MKGNVQVWENGAVGEDRRAHECPACGKRAAYVWSQDRFIHLDGSENAGCWRLIMPGQTDSEKRPVMVRHEPQDSAMTLPYGHEDAADA